MKRLIHILSFVLLSISGAAQEFEVPLAFDIEKNRQYELDRRYEDAARGGGGAISLPFFDDFSRYSLPTNDPEIPVEWQRWSDDHTRINYTFGRSPISMGVVSFDGLDRTGYPYDFTDEYAEGPADTLTSLPVNLQGYTPADNVYLVFHYQGEGLGNAPESDDSLYLDFFSPFGQGEWFQKWSVPGAPMATFQRVFIHITEPEFLMNGFRFRFRNDGRLSGNYDMWHLDYIVLDQQIDPETFDYDEVAMQYPVITWLNEYSAMPWVHYQSNPTGYMAGQFLFYQNNPGPNTENITSGWSITYDGVKQDFPNQTFNIQNNHRSEIITPGNLNGYAFDPTLTDTCAVFDICVYHNPADAYPQNDTICFRQEFTDYYAYDDGSAERAFALQSQGGMVALRFQSAIEDTLIGVRINWTPYGLNLSNSPFLLRVWNDGGGIPGSELVENFTFQNPQYYHDGYDIFTYHAFDQPVAVSGTFYVGWVQSNDVPYYVGNDKNRDTNTGKLFVMISNNVWQQSSITGSILVRPVFKSRKTPITTVSENEENGLSIYPNPANDLVNLSGIPAEANAVNIFDISGRMVKTERLFGQRQLSVDMRNLHTGTYILQISGPERIYARERLMIQH